MRANRVGTHIANTRWTLFLIALLTLCGACLCASEYRTSLHAQFPHRVKELESILGMAVEESFVAVREFSSVASFTRETGAPYWVRGFTNANGICLQSRHLLGESVYRNLLEHELLHWTIRRLADFPLWFEEGIVCLITGELSGYRGIPVMKNVEAVDPLTLKNPWEMVSYSLGCVETVKEILYKHTEGCP